MHVLYVHVHTYMSRLKDVLAGNTEKIDQNKLNFFLQKTRFLSLPQLKNLLVKYMYDT